MISIGKIFLLAVSKLLSAPIFPGDDEKTRSAAILNTMLIVLTGAISVLLVAVVFVEASGTLTVSVMTFVLVLVLGLQIPMRRGAVRQASFLLVLVMTLGVTGSIAGSGTVSTPSGAVYFVLVSLMVGLLISRRAAFFSLMVNCLIFFLLQIAEIKGFLPPPVTGVGNSYIQAIAFVIGAVWTVILLNLATRSIEKSLALAHAELAERQRVEAQEAHRREMLGKVINLGKLVTEVADYRTVLLRIYTGVRDELGFDRVGIFTYDTSRDVVCGSYGTDRRGNLVEEWQLEVPAWGKDFFGGVLNLPDSFYFTSDYGKGRNLQPTDVMSGVKFYAAVSAWAGDKPVAILCVDQLVSGREITDAQLEALRLFAGYVGLAIENAHLDQREHARQEMLEKVIRLGKQVTSEVDYQTVLHRIWSGIRSELDFDRVGLFLYDPSRKTMRGSYGTDRNGDIEEIWHREFSASGGDFFEHLLGQPDDYFVTRDYETECHVPPGHGMRGVKHYAAVSAWAGDRPVAIITVDQLISGREITDEQLEALRFFAGYAGLAIENARLNLELEQRVEERTADLETANKELESFSYSVSHDLRAPLRSINGFAKILQDDFSQDFPPQARSFLNKILDEGKRMGFLIDDLLDFSRLGRKQLEMISVDVNTVVRAVIESLAPEIGDRQIEWVLADLPRTCADAVLLQQVFANLIGNAVKYTGRRELARIEIGSFTNKEEVVYFIRDNGAGFNMQYANKLFGVFQRLHRDDEFEGTGIGLATVRRVIERHGGRIWAEAEVDKGATFYFTIPQDQR